ncbi:MAG: NAD(P)-dependent oxidoreductase [Bryobacterales bacterium]|nr:NAD(P)-dependent oxidoreductase [Bryobacterales bacterium]MBV9397721.1 NAD(P)-dependent oxidoreductase [Bryobacterales bacterium]
MAKLGFLGLGIMGYPMAQHLLTAGHEVALWSNTGTKAKQLATDGKGTACVSPKEVAERSDYVFYCVGDSEMSREVAIGKGGLIEGAGQGTVIADCSTIAPAVSQEIGKAFAAKGAHFLDAPCTGSKPGAEKATLTFMVGGEKAAFERAKPHFEIMGKLFYYCGGPGRGLQAKLTQNLILGNLWEAFAEGMVLAVKGGVDPQLMLDILENSAAKSGLISFKAPFVLARNFETNFSTKWLHKDIGLAIESADQMDVPLPLTALTQQMLRAAIAKGWGDQDFCSSIQVLEDWAGVEVKKA